MEISTNKMVTLTYDLRIDDELIRVGHSVPMTGSNGQRLNGVVLAVNEDSVKMDFNHPLAEEDLFLLGKYSGSQECFGKGNKPDSE